MHTQCPKCRTIFNVTEQILAVKAGLVRCGDCENVFNATWNLVDEADDVETQAPAPSAPPRAVSVRLRRDDERAGEDFPLPPREAVTSEPWPTPAPADDDGADVDGGDDDPLAGDTDDWPAPRHGPTFDEDDGDDGNTDDDLHDEEENRATQRHERAFGPLVRDPGTNRTDTSGAWEVLEDDDVDEDISDEEIRRTLRLDRALDDEEHDDDDDDDDDDNGDPGEREAPDDTPVRPMRQSDDPPAGMGRKPAEPAGGRIEPRFDAAPTGGLSVNADDGLLPRRAQSKPATARSPLRRKPAIQLKAPPAAPRPAPRTGGRNERIDPNVHWVSIPDNDRRGAQFLWASGVLLMIVLVVLQVRFFLVDKLYAIEGTRPYVSLFCDFAGCSAPQRADPGSIEIAQTRVDLHPEVPGAIRINVNLINRAAFAQPYPALELTLSDTEGRIVGRRTYQPSDYLAERPGTALLDPGILAVAAINLAHPNENAVGFETRVVASAAD